MNLTSLILFEDTQRSFFTRLQGKGIGRAIFAHLLDLIKITRPDIMRVELISREFNLKAISFYESLGFRREGRLEKRIRSNENEFEADIPMAWFNPNFKN